MDRANDMQRFRRSLQEGDDKVRKQKADQYNMVLNLQFDRVQADIRRSEERCKYDDYISLQRAELDKGAQNNHSECAKRVRTEQIVLLNKASNDLRAAFDQKIQQERALSNEVLLKAREENDANLKKERENIDSIIGQARAELVELENERSKLKSLIQSFNNDEARGRMNEVPHGMIYMPRSYFNIAVNNYCRPDVIMKFKVHKVKELYSDLEKFDLRADLREFSIVPPATTVSFDTFTEALSWHGYIGDAEVYYLKPEAGSEPLTGLVKITGVPELNQMVHAHAQEGTKICHLYLVSRYEDCHPDDNRGMKSRLPWESDEEGEQGETSDAKRTQGM